MMEWSDYKDRGNMLYQAQKFNDAVHAYDEALDRCTNDGDKATVMKNRAAAYIRLGEFDRALADCDATIHLFPRDIKALYRRAQSLEGKDQLSEAFKAVKRVLTLDPKNKEASELARRITEAIRRQANVQQSTSEKVKDMFATLESGNAEASLKIQAARNFAILSRDPSGRSQLLSEQGVGRLVKILTSNLDDVVHHILQTFVGLCGSGPDLTVTLVHGISLDKLMMYVNSSNREISSSAVLLLKSVILTLSSSANREIVISIIKAFLDFVVNPDVSETTRDVILEAFTATIKQVCIFSVWIVQGVFQDSLGGGGGMLNAKGGSGASTY